MHRDIKLTNIFLTGNNTIKLGDFGISRVLESTQEAAMTVVGTPYYMSPEVCESKPYTFKSDVWALGCVLYELCTLEHPFQADNLLGLVYKIVREEPKPIQDVYSQELHDIVNLLLTKDVNLRPTIQQLLKIDYVRQFMEDFISKGGIMSQKIIKTRKLKKY